MGAKGALIFSDNKFDFVPAIKVKSIDTTAAGDVFNGALTVALANGLNLKDSAAFAAKAAALSVTRPWGNIFNTILK